MTEQIHVYTITPQACFHVGLEGIGQERLDDTFRSDALFGAVLQQWQLLYGDDWQELLTKEPFAVTSCFPLAAGLRYYPVPCGSLDRALLRVKGSAVKKLKRIRYVSETIFQGILMGTAPPETAMPQDIFLAESSAAGIPGQSDLEVPRIAIDPVSGSVSEGSFFYCTNRYLRPDNGLFFLARFNVPEVQARFEAALSLLGDTGIGGDRSIGRGAFTWSRADFSLKLPQDADCHVCLSLCHPSREEVKANVLSRARYSLVRRHGYVTGLGARSLRRQSVLMLEEGAVFFGKAPSGDIPVVLNKGDGGSPFSVARYGRAFTLPAKGGCFEQHT